MDTPPQTPPATPDRPARIIKRYSNRKLYDTKDSRYVTLVQIAEMVRTGEEVRSSTTTRRTTSPRSPSRRSSTRSKGALPQRPVQTLKELIHARTEKVLADLREGPIGRLIPGGRAGRPAKKRPSRRRPPAKK